MNISVKCVHIDEINNYCQPSVVLIQKEYLQLLSRHFKFKIKYLIALNTDSGQTLSAMAIFEKYIIRIANIISPQITYYQALEYFFPLKKNSNQNELTKLNINKAIASYIHKHFLKVDFNLYPQCKDPRGFQWSGFNIKPLFTYTQILRDYSSEQLFKNQRTSLRKAFSMNYMFSKEARVDEFLQLTSHTKQRSNWNFSIKNDQLSNFINSLIKAGIAEQFCVFRNNNELVASVILLQDKNHKISYAWLATTLPEEMKNGVTPFLYDRLFNYLKDDYELLDLCGANTESIARFKTSLGTKLETFFKVSL
jgi:hypothetical protein